MNESVSKPDTAGELAYRQIRHDIVCGNLAPGSRLKLEGLKGVYGASVSTLREILNRLSSERLVIAEGQRGFEVASMSKQHFQEVALMRELLEIHALKESFERGDVEWEGRIVSAHHKLARIETQMSPGEGVQSNEWKHYDREFHAALISACGSAELMATHRQIDDQYLRYQVVVVLYRGEKASEEHKQLLDFALARNHVGATSILKRHIRACVQRTVQNGLLLG